MMIGIIGAMAIEVDRLKEDMSDVRCERISGVDYFCGTLFTKPAVVAQCGIGKVAAAVCAQTMILRYGVTHVINTGIGGTLTERLSILDIAVSDGVVEHDMDTSPIGDPVGLISGINLVVVPTSKPLADKALAAAAELGYRAESGIVASGDQFIANAQRKKFIIDNFSAICCEMEGAAIGHTCYLSGVECVIIRAISDSATGEAELEYPEMCERAAARSHEMIKSLLAHI